MPRIALAEGAGVHCIVDDFLWPWVDSTPMMHGFARNAIFWNRWVPAIAETHRVYRPDLLGCGLSDQPPRGPLQLLSWVRHRGSYVPRDKRSYNCRGQGGAAGR
jgi:pimeloyl-ACP methyl ester carboxylesterase